MTDDTTDTDTEPETETTTYDESFLQALVDDMLDTSARCVAHGLTTSDDASRAFRHQAVGLWKAAKILADHPETGVEATFTRVDVTTIANHFHGIDTREFYHILDAWEAAGDPPAHLASPRRP